MTTSTSTEPQRRTGRDRRSIVVAKDWVTPHLVRITVAGDLDDFDSQGTDQHVALLFHPREARLPKELTLEAIQGVHEFAFTRMRRYTIRRWDPQAREVDFDFVVHEPDGLASSWARHCDLGDTLLWWGPTPAWEPRPDASEIVLIGDESALPAIDAIVAEVTDPTPIRVLAEVSDERDERYLAHHQNRAQITWVTRGGSVGNGSPALLAALDRIIPDIADPAVGRQVWAAAEFATVGNLRRRLLGPGRLSKDEAFLVTYWTHGQAQDYRPEARGVPKSVRNRREDPARAARWIDDDPAAEPTGTWASGWGSSIPVSLAGEPD